MHKHIECHKHTNSKNDISKIKRDNVKLRKEINLLHKEIDSLHKEIVLIKYNIVDAFNHDQNHSIHAELTRIDAIETLMTRGK